MSTSTNNIDYRGWYLDDYTFEFATPDNHCNTLIISPLENAKIISFYMDNRGRLHAIVKEQPYLQYRPINITVKLQKCPDEHGIYFTKINNDFDPENILLTISDNGMPQRYVYKDMSCEYWKKESNIQKIKDYFLP